jgi:hypothetical protein
MGEFDQSDSEEPRVMDAEALEELGREAVEAPALPFDIDVLGRWAYSAAACDTEMPADVRAAFDALDAMSARGAPGLGSAAVSAPVPA